MLVRGRICLLQQRASLANKIHSLLLDNVITKQVKPLSVSGREILEQLSVPAPWNELLRVYLAVIDTLTDEMERLDDWIEDRADGLEATRLLKTMPGISHYSALVIYAEIGEIGRFDAAKEVVRHVGLNPVVRESGDSRFEGSISKNGSGRVPAAARASRPLCRAYGRGPVPESVLRSHQTAEEQAEGGGGDRTEAAGIHLSHAGSGRGVRPTRRHGLRRREVASGWQHEPQLPLSRLPPPTGCGVAGPSRVRRFAHLAWACSWSGPKQFSR